MWLNVLVAVILLKLNLNLLWLNDPRAHKLHPSSEISVLSVLKPVCFIPRNSGEVRCVCVCSPSGEHKLTISTPQISAHTVSMLSLLSSHTPVTTQQLEITLCCETHTPVLCPPAATVVYPLSPDESLFTAVHSVLLQEGRVCVCVCQLCVFFLQHTTVTSHRQ